MGGNMHFQGKTGLLRLPPRFLSDALKSLVFLLRGGAYFSVKFINGIRKGRSRPLVLCEQPFFFFTGHDLLSPVSMTLVFLEHTFRRKTRATGTRTEGKDTLRHDRFLLGQIVEVCVGGIIKLKSIAKIG